MTNGDARRLRVTLRWIQIKDNKDAAWDDEGEFRFRSCVTTAGRRHEVEMPEQGHWAISDHPRRNKVDKIDRVLFDGEPGDSLVVELFGWELDPLSKSDALAPYRREYTGDPASWVGRHQPTDEGASDPENLIDWRVAYDVELTP